MFRARKNGDIYTRNIYYNITLVVIDRFIIIYSCVYVPQHISLDKTSSGKLTEDMGGWTMFRIDISRSYV